MQQVEKLSSVILIITLVILTEIAVFVSGTQTRLFPSRDHVVVQTKYGVVEGRVTELPHYFPVGIKVNEFLGIPFASPPSGNQRFKPPVKPKAWRPRVYNATYHRNICVQGLRLAFLYEKYYKLLWPTFTHHDYSEDCLYLNIFAPNSTTNKTYPVMVYIHGGGYNYGSSILTPGNVLASMEVVVVTFQYRLGAFGFVSTGDLSAPGNYGMLDQVEALRWVKENINQFGGDPSKVTIFGQSAGGSSVGLHLLSPLSKGLFHRAIAESGVDISPWATAPIETSITKTTKLARALKCSTSDNNDMIECLRQKSTRDILKATQVEDFWYTVVDNNFLCDTPLNLRYAGKFHKVPFMAGFTTDDGSSAERYFGLSKEKMTLNLYKLTLRARAQEFFTGHSADQIGLISNALSLMYTPWGQTDDGSKLRQEIVNLRTDYWFAAPIIRASSIHSRYVTPVFLFKFNHRSKYDINPPWMGVTHAANVLYDFGIPIMNFTLLQQYDHIDRNVSKFVIDLYTNFAKGKHPTPRPMNDVQWKTYNAKTLAYLIIQKTPVVKYNFQPLRMAFWNDFLPKLLKQPRARNTTCNATDTTVTQSSASTITHVLLYYLIIFAFCSLFLVN